MKEHTLLYLTERETLRAGAEDMAACVDTMAEVLCLVAAGDYVMGGPSQNQHGLKLYFPGQSAFPGMPLAGPDRRFMALVGYLGGRFGVCGAKWYGSNPTNREKGLPRSIHTIILNDPETGAPICILIGNRISAMRTGAMVGLGARTLARPGADTFALVGVGEIGRAACAAVLVGCPTIRTVKIFNRTPARAHKAAQEFAGRYGVQVEVCDSLEQAVTGSDIVTYATSGPDKPPLCAEWIKPGALVTFPAECAVDDACFDSCKVVVDNWSMFEVYGCEAPPKGKKASGRQETDVARALACHVRDGRLSRGQIHELGPIVCGNTPGRASETETILLSLDGMCVEDLAWAHTVYHNALELGIGTKLPLF